MVFFIWNPEYLVQILNGPDFQMVGTIAKAMIKADHLKSGFQKICILNVLKF